MKFLLITAALLLNAPMVTANEDGAFLDAPYTNLVHPIVDDMDNKDNKSSSNTEELISFMTPVKSQGSRGTCSIFSAIAMLEGMLVIKKDYPLSTDLSEEFLEYLSVRGRPSDGSNSYSNFSNIVRYGVPTEATLPYIPADWTKSPMLAAAQTRCGHLTGNLQKSCLITHRDKNVLNMSDADLLDTENTLYDPDFVAARAEAKEFRNGMLSSVSRNYSVYYTSAAKSLLNAGVPLTMGITFYYGAWNHRKADEYGIGRDANNWNNGVVGFPEAGSMDRQESVKHGAGHSILIVGYDDEKVVTTNVKMTDGTMKTFTYKGVYYFKNSWGTGSFGAGFKMGENSYPGYGMILQKYVHTYGSFYKMPLN